MALSLSSLFTLLFSYFYGMHTAYGVSCPEKGNENWERKYYCGCYSCGGDSHVPYGVWERGYNQDQATGRYLTDERAGTGYIYKHYETWKDGAGNVYTDVDVIYRCYNCGYISWDGTIYDKDDFEVWNNVISFTGTDSDGDPVLPNEERSKGPQQEANGGSGLGPGAVPWYRCTFCDGENVGNYKHSTCYTITAKVSDADGGVLTFTGHTPNKVKIIKDHDTNVKAIVGPRTVLKITVAVKDGYKLDGWSSTEETNGWSTTGETEETLIAPTAGDASYTATVSPFVAETPTPEPENHTIVFAHHYYTRLEETGEETLDGVKWETYHYFDGTKKEYRLATARTYQGKSYTLENVEITGDCGLFADSSFVVSGTVTGDGTVHTYSYHTLAIGEHVHEYGDWLLDDVYHWKECGCGDIINRATHKFTKSAPDGDGMVTSVCDDCGYTTSAHRHSWIEWCAYDLEDDTYDAETYHWKICAYDSCLKTTAKAEHIKGDYVDEKKGYLVSRCTVCRWIMDEIPATVSITFHPNKGTFPDGSTEPVTYENITYGQPTDLWRLSEYFLPVREGMDFHGWYIVTIDEEGCVYKPDYENNVCIGTPEYFGTDENGNHTSKLAKSYTLYAHWRKPTYTVEYDGNGASFGKMYPSYHRVDLEQELYPVGYYRWDKVSYRSKDVSGNIEFTLSSTDVTAKFSGWALTPTGEPVYQDKETVVNLLDHAGTITLYATWEHSTIILPNADAADGGRKLSGWKTEDGIVISVLDENGNYKEVPYTLRGDETFTAVWIPNTYTVSFDSGGGTAFDPITVTYHQTYDYGNNGLPTPRRAGYAFTSWRNASTYEFVGNNSIVTTAADHVLVAVWVQNHVRVEFDYNFDYGVATINPEKHSTFHSLDENTDWTVKLYDEEYGTLPVPTRGGYNFACWYLEEDEYGNGCGHRECLVCDPTLLTTPGNHTLHARWKEKLYRIDLDYNEDYSVWGD